MINSDHFYYYERSLKRNIFGYINDQPKYHLYYIKCSLPHPNKGIISDHLCYKKGNQGYHFLLSKRSPGGSYFVT